MARNTIPDGIIKSELQRGSRMGLWIALGLSAFWAFLYLSPVESMVEGNGAPPFIFRVLERITGTDDNGFPWVSIIFTLITVFIAVSAVRSALKNTNPSAETIASEGLKESGIDLSHAVHEFETAMADGTGSAWNSIWITPEWVFMGDPINRLFRTSDIAWVHYRGSRFDKAFNAATSAALSASGALSSGQARAVRNEQSEGIVVVFHLKNEGFPVEFEVEDTSALHHLGENLSKHHPDLIFGWQKSFEAAWHKDRVAFTGHARARIEELKSRGETSLPLGRQ